MKRQSYCACVLAGSLTFFSFVATAQEPDNTKVNKRDQDKSAQQSTPQNATATKEDLETLRKIRRAITSDNTLSTYAQNVKITVKNGATTLRGPVRSTDEKARIEELAKSNGATSVTNELEIAPPK
jgi:hyperosmotically inducible periplasmic protein